MKLLRVRSSLRFCLACFLVSVCTVSYAQRTVSGTVTDLSNDEPLPGVNILVQGTTTGTVTDIDGKYSISVPSENAVLVISSVGYETMQEAVNNRSTINLFLSPDLTQLGEVVVTALGVERETKALGYSVAEVPGEQLTEARELNVANSLAGRVAGVVVSSPTTGPAGSSRVVIRGNASLTGNNQPLYVVDGIPMDNSNLGAAGMWGGKDLGDGISSLNPDDIENMTVLKGPTASALYGNRAQNGVILITTKKGSSRQGIGVEINSNTVFETPLIADFDEFQYQYGSGSAGLAPTNEEEALQFSRSAWGAPIQGQTVMNFDGVTRPYVAQRDNIRDFYDVGRTLTNTVSLSGGNETATFRFSGSLLDNEGIIPEAGLERYTINLRGTSKLGKKLSADVKINYIEENAHNRPSLSDTPENPGLVLPELAPTVSVNWLRDYEDEVGNPIPWTNTQFRTNPYWGVYNQTNEDEKQRLIGFVSLKYQFTDWLSFQLRTGTDQYQLRQTDIDAPGTSYVVDGRITEQDWSVEERNTDFLLLASKDIGSDFNFSLTLGGNHRTNRTEQSRLFGSNFFTRNDLRFFNTANQEGRLTLTELEVNSLYGAFQLGFRDYLFVDLTARNDWSSTLTNPLDPDGSENSFFYPSASVAFAFTDAIDINWGPLSFGKVRVSAAEVGNDTDPYVQLLTYAVNGNTYNGQGLGDIGTNQIPNTSLIPEENNALEAGLDMRFFEGRIGLDFTWYRQRANQLIVPVDVSQTSGFNTTIVNAGEVENEGVELLLTTTPVLTNGGFRWDLDVNFAQNRNQVLRLQEPIERLRIGSARSGVTVEARVGEPYGAIVGRPYRRTPDGQIIYEADGTPLFGRVNYDENGEPLRDENGNMIIDERVTLGVANPDWTAGITNTFSYKGFNISALIDIRQGGDIYSQSNSIAYGNGSHIATVEGREAWYASEAAREAAGVEPEDWAPTGGIVGPGVKGNFGEDGSYLGFLEEDNDVIVNPETYWGSLPDEQFVYDASFIKLRQLSIGYTFPQSMLEISTFQGLRVSLVGRNLAILSKNIDNIDPESTYSSRNDSQGFEYGTLPTTRSLGFNLNLRF
ncbi:MAG: SusC/RagA family TonB-linked outer membrane protein [Bacteroidota bacterium]